MPEESRQEKWNRDALIQDRFAMENTSLSNERTLLMYIRTALSFLVAGVALIHFFTESWLVAAGWIFLPVGCAFAAFGVGRFRYVRHVIHDQWRMRLLGEDERSTGRVGHGD